MSGFVLDAAPIAIIALFVLLGYLGWGKGLKWARVLLILFAVLLIAAGILFALYVQAMGQANWSL